MTNESTLTDVRRICASHRIAINSLKSITGSFDKQLFIINNTLLLRIAQSSMAVEQEKFRRVAALDGVPKIVHTGRLDTQTTPLYYTLVTLIPGDDFVNAYAATTTAQQEQLGQAVAAFLDILHGMRGMHYDIGLYIPILPEFTGTWREGHQQYWAMLEEGAAALALQPEGARAFADAFHWLHANADALDYQAGPVLLHNDLHPRNVLLHQGVFSGVIDWECAQYGEADFELTHFIHWCAYPPEAAIDYRPFLQALFQAGPTCTQVPALARRLSVYQIEHEIQQILWNNDAAAWRVPRLSHWLDGGVDALLQQIT